MHGQTETFIRRIGSLMFVSGNSSFRYLLCWLLNNEVMLSPKSATVSVSFGFTWKLFHLLSRGRRTVVSRSLVCDRVSEVQFFGVGCEYPVVCAVSPTNSHSINQAAGNSILGLESWVGCVLWWVVQGNISLHCIRLCLIRIYHKGCYKCAFTPCIIVRRSFWYSWWHSISEKLGLWCGSWLQAMS